MFPLRKAKPGREAFLSIGISLLLFVVMAAVLLTGTFGVSQSTAAQGEQALRQAIQRTAVLCYSSEGFYPPSLAYMEENYGLQIDRDRYFVHYDVFASNVMPTVQVTSKTA